MSRITYREGVVGASAPAAPVTEQPVIEPAVSAVTEQSATDQAAEKSTEKSTESAKSAGKPEKESRA